MVLSMVGCDGGKKAQLDKNTKHGEVWSAPSTVKVDEYDIDYASKGEAALKFKAVRNEYESRQLIISAAKDIDRFELKTTDLKKGEDIISNDNIEVYVEKYVFYDDFNGKGNMPDALIPLAIADEYEENQIQADRNGALWVTIYIPKETPEGTYEGSFQLVLEGTEGTEEVEIPVAVEVEDYTLTDEVHAESLFSWRYNRVAAGELDGSAKMMQHYYEYFQDYRISLQSLPLATLSGEEYAENVVKYYDRLTSYTILSKVGAISGDLLYHLEEAKEQILAVAAACDGERNLFDKAIIYCIDEPDMTEAETRTWIIDCINQLSIMQGECIAEIQSNQSGIYDGLKSQEGWEDSIRNIPNVMPILTASVEWLIKNENTQEGQDLLTALNCICPILGAFNDKLSSQMIAMSERNNIELWWYGCVSAVVPEPTYFIGDANLLSARSLSWLQKKFDVVGNLYWDAAAYTDENKDYLDEYINVYEKPLRKSKTALPYGDGFLTYPGAAYGLYGPLPSLRLMSIRDGMEEYELLYALEEKLEAMKDSFGEGFDVKKAMNAFYVELAYDGINANMDGQNGLEFDALRAQLIQLLTSLDKGLGFVMGNIETQNEIANITCYTQEGADLTINGETMKPVDGVRYEYTLNLEETTDIEVMVTNAEGKTSTYQQFVASPVYILNALSEETVLDGINVSDGSSVEFVEDSLNSTDGTAVHFNIQGVVTGNKLTDAVFIPTASFATSLFQNKKLTEMSTVNLDIYNPGESFAVKVNIYSGSSYVEMGEFEIGEGKTNLNLNLKTQNFSQIETADRIAFEFMNAQDGNAMSYEFYVDNIAGEK